MKKEIDELINKIGDEVILYDGYKYTFNGDPIGKDHNLYLQVFIAGRWVNYSTVDYSQRTLDLLRKLSSPKKHGKINVTLKYKGRGKLDFVE